MSNPVAADRLREYCEKLCVALCVEPGETWAVLRTLVDGVRMDMPHAHRIVRDWAEAVCNHPFAPAATGHHLFDLVLESLGWSKSNPLHLKTLAYVVARKTLYKEREYLSAGDPNGFGTQAWLEARTVDAGDGLGGSPRP